MSETTKFVGMLMNCVEFLEKSKLKDELQISFDVDSRYEITFKKLEPNTKKGEEK